MPSIENRWDLFREVLAVNLPLEILYKIVHMAELLLTEEEEDVARLVEIKKSVLEFKERIDMFTITNGGIKELVLDPK